MEQTNNGRELERDRTKTFYFLFGKRIFDFLVGQVGLILTSPILGLCAIAIRLDSSGPVFFRQWRVGQYGKLFRIFKLRTMVHNAEQMGTNLTSSDDSRITRVGKWLRKTKLDEVPQLLNVVRGEMTIVGPRPEVPEYVAMYTSEQKRVLDLKPGVTGVASLEYMDVEEILANCGNPEEFYIKTLIPRKAELDLTYLRILSFTNDVRLILRTLGQLVNSTDKKGRKLRDETQA